MRRLLPALTAAALVALAIGAAPASASLGLSNFDVTFSGANGSTEMQAGSHPYELKTTIEINLKENTEGKTIADEAPKDFEITQVPGLAGILTAVPRCSTLDFLTPVFASNASSRVSKVR